MSEFFTEVCIIGAGVSGLKAAQTLIIDEKSTLNPKKDILILEAQDHIGGRIHTDTTLSKLGYRYDLGASWFHDCLTNSVLHEFANMKDDSLLSLDRDCYYDDKDVKVYSSESEGPIDINSSKITRVVEDIEKFIELYFHDSLEVKDVSLEEIVGIFMKKYDKFLTNPQKQYSARFLRYLELWFGISWDKISGKYSIMDHAGRNLYNKKGNSFLIDHLVSFIPHLQIHLNQQVSKINRMNKKNDYKILVETNSGSKVYCNYLVVSVPQSILQINYKTSSYGIEWVPPLPSNMQDSLETIHFGALGKVIFEFDDVWWDQNEDRFEILANELSRDVNLSEPIKSIPPPFTYPVYAVNYASVHRDKILTNGGSSLVILTQSPLTEFLESNPDKAWQYYKPMLSKLVQPNKRVCDPINTISSNWTNNPHIRGSYSAVEVNDDPSSLLIQLSGEMHGCGLYDSNVRFAGEHTILDGAGCIHGAYDSGERAAKWIIEKRF